MTRWRIMLRRLLTIMALAAMALTTAAPADAAHHRVASGQTCQGSGGTVSGYQHVLVVMLENHSLSQTRGQMPYLDSLANECAYMTHESAITHPSLPNYFAITGGQTFTNNDGSPSQNAVNAQSIFGQVGDWKSYAQSQPGTCRLTNKFPYIAHHVPAVYYLPIRQACQTRAVSDDPLIADAQNEASFPSYAMLVPDNCHNGHKADGCGSGTTLGRADSYLASKLDAFLKTPTYQSGHTLVIVTFDEGSGGNIVYTVLASEAVKTGTVITSAASHYSLLELAERELGVGCLKASCNAAKIQGPGL